MDQGRPTAVFGQAVTGAAWRLGTELPRVPLWDIRVRPIQMELIAPTVLYGRQLRQVAGHALTVADQRLYAELTTRYIRE